MLEIKNLTKRYGEKKAVDNLSLTVNSGDIFGFIGHNGAGKTTTIKAVVGIISFEEGEILVDGHSVKADPMAVKQQIGYIPDNPDLYESFSGIKYINFIADIFGVPTGERQPLIERFATVWELKDALESPISSYSHGMKQKLALISALVHKPKLLILDEPFVGLDPKASHTLKEYMKEMTDAGSAIFFSTHVLEVAEKLCNRIAIIKEGALVTSGTMEEVKGDQSLEQIFLELTDHE